MTRCAQSAWRARPVGAAGVARAAACVPWLGSRFYTFLATEIVILALFALSLNLLLGYRRAGVVRPRRVLRHRRLHLRDPDEDARRAVPARLRSRPARRRPRSPLVFGFFCVRSTRIYFAMLTLAFAQIVWAVCFKWNAVTGGEQGLNNVPYPDLGWMAALPLLGGLRAADHYFLLVMVLVGVCFIVLRRIVGSPFGRMLTAIRENPERAEFVGLNVRALPAGGVRDRRRVRRFRRRAVRPVQPRRVPRLRVLVEVGRGADHGDPRRHGQLLGARRSAPRR